MLNKLRYLLLGKQIQNQLVRAEEAGRETSEYVYKAQIKDLENDLEEILNKHQREIDQLVNKKLSEMEYRFNPDAVLTATKNPIGKTSMIFLGKDALTDQEVRNLKQESDFFKESRLWGILTNTLKSQAQEIMFNRSANFEDMRSGKMMIFNIGVQENVIHTIDSFALE